MIAAVFARRARFNWSCTWLGASVCARKRNQMLRDMMHCIPAMFHCRLPDHRLCSRAAAPFCVHGVVSRFPCEQSLTCASKISENDKSICNGNVDSTVTYVFAMVNSANELGVDGIAKVKQARRLSECCRFLHN